MQSLEAYPRLSRLQLPAISRRTGARRRPAFPFGVPRRNVLHPVGNRPTDLRARHDPLWRWFILRMRLRKSFTGSGRRFVRVISSWHVRSNYMPFSLFHAAHKGDADNDFNL
jgi:hypothetical protein